MTNYASSLYVGAIGVSEHMGQVDTLINIVWKSLVYESYQPWFALMLKEEKRWNCPKEEKFKVAVYVNTTDSREITGK